MPRFGAKVVLAGPSEKIHTAFIIAKAARKKS